MSIKVKARYLFLAFFPYLILYFLIQSLIEASQYDLSTSLDVQIPFIPRFIWIYHTILPVIFLTGILLFKRKDIFLGLILAIIFAGALMCISYIMFPSFYPREAIIGASTPSEWLLDITRSIDGPHNTFPSSHVTFAWLLVFFVRLSEYVQKKPLIQHLYIVWAILISVSTLTLKQHFIVDVFSGIAMAAICFYIARKIDISENKNKLINIDDKFIPPRRHSEKVP